MLLPTLLTGLLLAAVANPGSTAPPTPRAVADRAFAAWAAGEATGNYAAFRALLGPSYRTFSHPLLGRFAGPEAAQKLRGLVAEREQKPNRLAFTNVVVTANDNTFLYQFDSAGEVAGGYPYRGYNVLAFEVAGGELVGMREYFGFVDPQWFKQ
ncbi:hypothetical protein [Hymenobacter sp.]|uniref:hypothetical protein n=1 Tax=Hymenobacter sp. TaxID=1898978 RepID=UPI00286AACFD|nr:hypothetical protein [Hymenobacter sp.]